MITHLFVDPLSKHLTESQRRQLNVWCGENAGIVTGALDECTCPICLHKLEAELRKQLAKIASN